MEYEATFGIDGGVSPGFGVKYPDYTERTEKISAVSPQDAHKNAMDMAGNFVVSYLSNQDKGVTTVQLLSIRGSDEDSSFDGSKSVVKRSMLDHLLALDFESDSNE